MGEVQISVAELFRMLGEKEATIIVLNRRLDGLTQQYTAAMARVKELEGGNEGK